MTQRPFLPDDVRRAPAARHALQHAVFAALAAAARNTTAGAICQKIFPDDPVALALLTRAAISGAATDVPVWAGTLAQQAVSQWLGSLAPQSAAAALMAQGVSVPVTDGIPVHIPVRATGPTAAPWVDEQGAIPMRAWSFAHVDLSPRKLGILVSLTRELARSSAALPIFEAVLMEESAASLDACYFSTTATSESAHAGLLAGLTPGTGSAFMADDLAGLAEAVGTNGSGRVVFVMGPGRAAACAVRQPAEATATVLPSLACPEGRVICIDPVALVHGFGLAPEILASEQAVVHLSDTPGDIGTPGSPAAVAAPTESMFQSAMIALRLLLDVAFAVRRPGAVAYLDGATW